ncbi:MAG: hypothetical protein ACXVPN_06085 [Bacteroidia bacterium]
MSREEIHMTGSFYANAMKRGIYLVIQHANRIPPHIGLMIDDEYHSLTIKGKEISVSGNALLKNIGLRKIPTVFVKIKKHPVFSNHHLNEVFIEQLKQFDKVSADGNTCLSPIKLFFEEFYAIKKEDIKLIFDLLGSLKSNDFIEETCGMNLGEMKQNIFYLQPYNESDLKVRIMDETQKVKS